VAVDAAEADIQRCAQHRREGHRRDSLRERDRRAPIVSMPHWCGIIPEQQLRALVAYLKTLK
jgi:hypothetical protein